MKIRKEDLILLNMIDGLGPIKIKALLDYFRDSENIFRANRSELTAVFGIGEVMAANILSASNKDLQKELDLIEKCNVKIIVICDSDYPDVLKNIYDPPPVLYVKGDILPEDDLSVALVGSRRATHYGLSMSESLAYDLALKGATITSGLARGIDSAAHRGALRANGRSIAVLGSGLNEIYPPENKKLAQEISESGAVVSEFPMGMEPLSGNFPRRNRIISGLSQGVVVVEANQRSGALITVDYALEQGREVFAVPGKIDSCSSRGTNELIKQGAKLVTSADDILSELNMFPQKPGERKEEYRSAMTDLSDEENSIYYILSDEPTHIDNIISTLDMPAKKVSDILTRLSIRRLVKELPGKNFAVKQ